MKIWLESISNCSKNFEHNVHRVAAKCILADMFSKEKSRSTIYCDQRGISVVVIVVVVVVDVVSAEKLYVPNNFRASAPGFSVHVVRVNLLVHLLR